MLDTLELQTQTQCRVFKTLSSSLPCLHLLQNLRLYRVCAHFDLMMLQVRDFGVQDMLSIGRSLKAWPLPLLHDLKSKTDRGSNISIGDISFRMCWQALGLPPEAVGWDNKRILDFFRIQQQKVVAFAGGMHARLGDGSVVLSMNELAFVMIADEVLGGWSLLKQWKQG